jgi:peptidoglycan/xylan/chitin deacetylase (PgdA/CDA1 family)
MPRSRFLPDEKPDDGRFPPDEKRLGDRPAQNPKPVTTPSRVAGRGFGAGFLVLAVVVILASGFSLGRSSLLRFNDDSAQRRQPTAVDALTALGTVPSSDPGRPAATPSRLQVTPAPLPVPTSVPVMRSPNELGRIPILMYHAFVLDPEHTDEWTLTLDQFRDQLDWLRESDFVMVGLNSVIHRNLDIPAGKRPVILTFDDSSAGQFGLHESAAGGFEVDPDSAVGVLEAYRNQYPDFVGPAFFAVLPFNCFASSDDPSTCEERLRWLVDHGYEVGNHTNGHQNLTDVSDERLGNEIMSAKQWIDERIDGPNNLSNVLVLPYGAYPADDRQKQALFTGFRHHGGLVRPTLVIEVSGGTAASPYSTRWEVSLGRYNTDPATFQYWADQFSSGETQVYVSDGDPNVLTVRSGWEEYVDMELLAEDSLVLRVID